jgi:putative ABC transport system permease protein
VLVTAALWCFVRRLGFQSTGDASRALLWLSDFTLRVLLVESLAAVVISPRRFSNRNALADSRRGRSSSGSVSRQRPTRGSEIALALVVATGAGLMVKSFLNARNVDPGFNPSRLAAFRLGLTDNRYPTPDQVVHFEQTLLERLRALPGVTSATSATSIPMSGLSYLTFSIEGRDLPKIPIATNTLVFPNYFETMQIPMRAGLPFSGHETVESPSVAIINETLARRFFPGVNPVGKRIKWGSPTSWRGRRSSSDVKAQALDSPQEPAVYFPAAVGRV